MAVTLFSLTVTGSGGASTIYEYKTDSSWYKDGNKQESFAGASVSTNAGDDGYYTVTVNKAIFDSGTPTTGYSVTLTDTNLDRKSFKLALGSNLETYKYGSGQSALAKYNEDIESTILSISNISAGLFVETGGKKISWETDTSDKEINVDGIAKTSDEDLKKTIWVDGKNIIVGANALSNDATSLNFTGAEGYYFSLSGVSISQYTEEGWNFTSGGTSAAYYSASSTTGWQVTNSTNISYNNTASGGSSLFNVSGLTGVNDQSELVGYFNIDSATNRNVSLTQAGVSLLIDGHSLTNGASTAITLKDTDSNDGVYYGLALGALSDFDHSGYSSAAFTGTSVSSTYNYSSSHHGIYGNANTDYGHSSTLAIYADKPLYQFSLSGLATGLVSSSGVLNTAALSYVYTDKTGQLDVTLRQSAVAEKNIFGTALSDFGSVIFRNGGISVPEGGNSAQLLSLGSGSFTFQAQGNSGGTYTNFDTDKVYFHGTSFGGQKIKITGLSADYTSGIFDSNGILWGKINGGASTAIATIKPVTDGEGNTTFDIAFNDSAFSSIGGNIGVSSAGGSFAYNLSLTDLNRADYAEQKDYTFQVNGTKPSATTKSLSAIGGGSYRFIDSYVPAYFSAATTNNSLAAGSGVTYTYIGAASHIDFSITGLSKADNLFNTATTTTGGYSSVFTYSPTGTSSLYTITLKENVVKLLNGSDSGVKLTIKDNNADDGISYLLSNPSPISHVSAALKAGADSGTFVYNTSYSTAGWSALGGNNSASTAFQFYGQANGVSNAFTLTGLTGIGSNSTFTVTTGSTSNIIKLGDATIGTVSEGTGFFTFNAAGFSKAAGITSGTSTASIKLTDSDASDKTLYKFVLGTGMSYYGASNWRAPQFVQGSTSYTYTSGGLKEGYNISSASIANLSGSYVGQSILTWYAGAKEKSFSISGVVKPGSSSAVLDYVKIGSKEELLFYTESTTGTTQKRYKLKAGNYQLTNNIDLGDDGIYIYENVAIDLNGYKISTAGVSSFASSYHVFIIKEGGDLTVNDTSANKTGSIVAAYGGGIICLANYNTGQNTENAKPATLTVNAGTVQGGLYGISGNGNSYPAYITINGGKVIATNGTGIFYPTYTGTLVVNDGEITGNETGIEIRAGNLYVNGGKITSTASSGYIRDNGSGTTTAGAGIAVVQHTTKQNINVNILGGEIQGYTALYVDKPQTETEGTLGVNVLGGTLISQAGSSSVNMTKADSGTSVAAFAGSYAIYNADYRVDLNIGAVSIASGGISFGKPFEKGSTTSASAGDFNIFVDSEGNTLAKGLTGSGLSKFYTYSETYQSVLAGVSVPILSSSTAIVVGDGVVTLNRAALSTANVYITAGDFSLALGSDVTQFNNRTEKIFNAGWMLTGLSGVSGMVDVNSIDKATWQGNKYLESWAISGNSVVKHYNAAGGASIGVAGLSYIATGGYNSLSTSVTNAAVSSFFTVKQIGGDSIDTPSISGYTLTVNAGNSLFWALDEGEELSFSFNPGRDKTLGLSNVDLSIAGAGNYLWAICLINLTRSKPK